MYGYVNNQAVFGMDQLPKYGLFGFIGPNTTPKIIQNISKMWDEVYNNRVITLVHGLILVWPNHWREGASDLAIPQLMHELVQ